MAFDWKKIDYSAIASKVVQGIKVLAPIAANVLSGGAVGALSTAATVLEAAAKGVPSAIALVQSIEAGHTPTAEQIKSVLADYDAAHDDLEEAIHEQLEKTGGDPATNAAGQTIGNQGKAPPAATRD